MGSEANKYEEPDYVKLDERFVQGFNMGYQGSKFLTEFVSALEKTEADNPWIMGFKQGSMEYALEKAHEQLPFWLKSESDFSKDFDQAKDRDKDLDKDTEPER